MLNDKKIRTEQTLLGIASLIFSGVAVFLIYAAKWKIWNIAIGSLLFAAVFYVLYFFQTRTNRYLALGVYAALLVWTIGTFAEIYQDLGIVDSATNEVVKEVAISWYFSTVTWTTLGYGDFRPTEAARAYAAIEAIFGYLYMAILVGKILHLLTSARRQ